MSIFKAVTTIIGTPVRCLGELGKDLSSLTDDIKDSHKPAATHVKLAFEFIKFLKGGENE